MKRLIEHVGPSRPEDAQILTDDALRFLTALAARFTPSVESLLTARRLRQRGFDASVLPRFLPETAPIRAADWRIAPVPKVLEDRRVEITGPVDRKMIINALNSGANVFMADFEDSSAPTWRVLMDGQRNLRDAVRGTIKYQHPTKGEYRLGDTPATLMVRPRGWHLPEAHLRLDGKPLPAALVDFGLYFFHNAAELVARGSGPFFYLPKLEHHDEARLWNEVFVFAQDRLGIAQGTIKATVLIETLPAAFQIDEILYALRDHSAGLNCGRWDYIFSYIKTLRAHADKVLPDRGQVGMTQRCMRSYSQLVIKTCHRRGAHAMGGMAAQIPIKRDADLNAAAMAKVRSDKEREAADGHDGTWVAHPGLVALAREIFDAQMPGPNQLHVMKADLKITEADLLAVPTGTRTLEGLALNVRVGVQYIEAWLGGNGCVPLYDLMEDAATAEISRTQIWQWIRHGARLEDGTVITADHLRVCLSSELAALRSELGADRFDGGHFSDAARLFERLATADQLTEFLTLPAYELLLETTSRKDPS